VPWEIAGSSRALIEALAGVIRLSTAQKSCQERVNTRENASKRRSVSLYRQARAHPQSIVLSRSFRCCSLSLPEVSQTCSQLIHTRLVVVLASGLETRNLLRKRQEKNEFNFRLPRKNFLTGKMKHACRRENENSVSKKIRATQTATTRNRRGEQTSSLITCGARVDRIGLCADFSASASEGKTLSEL
jgi:hypothetical protein